ncbi:MAG TPA: hypothetical protein VK452_03530 [Dissulfurispiraceae bacterium]|nr:hypothetical protein [Dissulfurispiraceae bacterium]
MPEKCRICKGTFWYDSQEKCEYCNGTSFIGYRPCTKCKGGHAIVRKPCAVCNPNGKLADKQLIIR